jgi:hypothetical protein
MGDRVGKAVAHRIVYVVRVDRFACHPQSLPLCGAAFGVSRGLGYMVGIVAGVAAMMVLVATGLTGLMLALPGAAPAVAALAAA